MATPNVNIEQASPVAGTSGQNTAANPGTSASGSAPSPAAWRFDQDVSPNTRDNIRRGMTGTRGLLDRALVAEVNATKRQLEEAEAQREETMKRLKVVESRSLVDANDLRRKTNEAKERLKAVQTENVGLKEDLEELKTENERLKAKEEEMLANEKKMKADLEKANATAERQTKRGDQQRELRWQAALARDAETARADQEEKKDAAEAEKRTLEDRVLALESKVRELEDAGRASLEAFQLTATHINVPMIRLQNLLGAPAGEDQAGVVGEGQAGAVGQEEVVVVEDEDSSAPPSPPGTTGEASG